MNRADASAVVAAVLYEGYILYPYRPSSVKNQQRWTFGGVFPAAFAHADGGDPCAMQTQCLRRGDARTRVELCVGFLHLVAREIGSLAQAIGVLPATGVPQFTPVASLDVAGARYLSWEEAVEREISGVADNDRSAAAGVWRTIRRPGQPERRSDPRRGGRHRRRCRADRVGDARAGKPLGDCGGTW